MPGVVIVTGGSSGIGRCTALHFARRGWRVGLIARGETALADAAAQMRGVGARTATATADVASGTDLRDAADAIVRELGPPNVWINCAGNGVYGQFVHVPEAQFDRVTAVTYGGTVNGCRVALALMAPELAAAGPAPRPGAIVNVCSGIAYHGMPLMTSYAGAKAATRGFSQALQAELRIRRSLIRISTIFPPAVNTPFFSHAISHMGWPARPVPPVYQPEVVAAAIYLAVERGWAEMAVTGTVATLSLVNRIAPRLIAFAMTRLGLDSQISREPAAARLEQPTLFDASIGPAAIHGPFAARRWSTQVWVRRHGLALLSVGVAAGVALRWATRRRAPS